MIYIKIELPHGPNGLEYPSGYGQLESSIVDHLYVDEETEGNKKTVLCLSVKGGTNWNSFLGNQDRITELTKEEMVDYCTPHEKKLEVVTDEARIRRLTIKAQLGQQLTEEELKAIDPEDETPGFGYTKRFIDKI